MKVFISHTSRDKEVAYALAEELREKGISTYSDQYFLPVSSVEKQARTLLKESDAIIAILSKYSFSSESVRTELDEAMFEERFKDRFFPVLLSKNSDDLQRLPWILQSIQHLRLSHSESPKSLARKIAEEFQKFISRRQ